LLPDALSASTVPSVLRALEHQRGRLQGLLKLTQVTGSSPGEQLQPDYLSCVLAAAGWATLN
jgi:hypothetical protein